MKHKYIPPQYPNANADVESSHKIIEDEFYEVEHFKSKEDFLVKAFLYQFYFNYYRQNSYKEWKTPMEILKKTYPDINPLVGLIAPVIVDHYLKYFFPISCRQSIKIIYKYYISLFHHVSKHPT